MKSNDAVSNYLKFYIEEITKPEFAVLLIGKWGSGKTYFINNFIEIFSQDSSEIKFIKISLFGKKNLDEIGDEIFTALHPIIGSKYTKFATNIFKSAVKFNMGFDIDNDKKEDIKFNIPLDNFASLFSAKPDKDKKIVFVFDDLERSDIEIKTILGYINYLVEISNFHTIILANEEKITKDTYSKFKEKVIGKTFEITHKFEDVLDSFLENEKLLKKHKSVIINIYNKAGYNNLRHIKQTISDFNYFVKFIDKKYLKEKKFLKLLIHLFFALSIEIKGNGIDADSIDKLTPASYLLNDGNDKIKTIVAKYAFDKQFLFNKIIWTDILFKSKIDKELINNEISKLFTTYENKKPLWLELWNYFELEDNEFNEKLKQLLKEFNGCKLNDVGLLLHYVALLVYFAKENFIDIALEEIEQKALNCLNNIENYQRFDLMFGAYSYGFYNSEDPDFIKIYEAINNIVKEKNLKKEEDIRKQQHNQLLEALKNNDKNFLISSLLGDKRTVVAFDGLSVNDFFENLLKSKNKTLAKFNRILIQRYEDNYIVNGVKLYIYLKSEKEFFNQLKYKLNDYNSKNDKKVQKKIIDNLIKIIDDIVEKMESK